MIVVAVAMLGSLTVLPALLVALGDKVEKGRIPFLRPAPPRGRREPLLVGDPDPGAAAPGRRRSSLSVGVLVALALPVLHIHTAQSGLDALPKSIADGRRRSTGSRTAFPGGADAGARRDQGDTPTPRRCRSAIAELRTAGARERPDDRPDRGRRQRRPHASPGSRSRSRATAPTRRRSRRSHDAPRRRSCRRRSAQSPARPTRSPAARRPRPTRTRCSSTPRRSCSASCSRSRSCCCSSRSARS